MTRNEHQNVHFLRSLGNKNELARFCFSRLLKNKKIIILGGIILTMGIFIGAYQCFFSAPEKEAEFEQFIITIAVENDDSREIAEQLKKQGFIKNKTAFHIALLGLKGINSVCVDCIMPGAYKISKSMNVWQIAEVLEQNPYMKWITVLEGFRKEEIAEIAKRELRWSEDTKEEFLNYAEEGYLFPDTYLLQVLNFENAGKITAKRMENNFNEKCQEIFKEFAGQNIRNDTAIILASIIQREAANEKEMPLIAGIIWNRLLKPMPLQIDATIQYIVGEPDKWWRPVTTEEYKIESPYNTYLYEGRPHAPICNPGLAAIEAVVLDQPSDYFYYLHDSDGQIHLAKTYEEHLENIEKYLK